MRRRIGVVPARDLIRVVLKRVGPLSRKKLIKILYLIELKYIETTSKRLTDIEYIKYTYGPYSREIINVAEKDPYIKEVKGIRTLKGYSADLFVLSKDYVEPKEILENKILMDIIDFFSKLNRFWGKESGTVLEVLSKKTEPFIKAKKEREKLNLNLSHPAVKYKKILLKAAKNRPKIKPLPEEDIEEMDKDFEEAFDFLPPEVIVQPED